MTLFWGDLVAGPKGTGTPFVAGGVDPTVGLDCKAVVWIMLRRFGCDVPPLKARGAEHYAGVGAQAYLDGYLGTGESWEEVEDPCVGDLIVTEGPHVSFVVQKHPLRVITALEERGVLVMPIVDEVERVLRWVG